MNPYFYLLIYSFISHKTKGTALRITQT